MAPQIKTAFAAAEPLSSGEKLLHRWTAEPAEKRIQVTNHARTRILVVTLIWLAALSVRAHNDEISNSYRFSLYPYRRITDRWTGFSYLEFRNDPDKDSQGAYIDPGVAYTLNSVMQFWTGLNIRYTDNENSADTFELRPWAGIKLFLPNNLGWNIFNYVRYEHRSIEELDTHNWNDVHRVRSRFGVEIPLTTRSNAWLPKTWYTLADVEPIYRFDRDTVDPLRVRGGLGWVASDRIRIEFIYYAEFTRLAVNDSLRYTDNVFRVNIKIALSRGIVGRIFHQGTDD